MTDISTQRDFAEQVVRQLRDAGHEALWAGGCVRDELLSLTPKDYDVATSARPEQVRELFGRRRTLAIGAAFGVISVLGRNGLDPIEVATFRSDGAYIDGRHPTEVTFTSAAEDAQRRDFTINGLFFDPIDEQLIDYVGGEDDLRAGLIRAIGDPVARFEEDKLRMLRAVRFATTFEFEIDEPTAAAIRSMAGEVQVVSAERIGVELRKILKHRERARGVELLCSVGLLRPLLPNLADCAEDDESKWNATLKRLRSLHSDSLPAGFAALLLDCADSKSLRDHGRGFRFTNKEIDRAAWLLDSVELVEQSAEMPWPRLQRVLIHEGADELLLLAEAAFGEVHPGVRHCRERLAMPADELNPTPLVTGDDLVSHGLKPGKHFGQLLDHLRDLQLEGELDDLGDALKLADQWTQRHGK